MNCFPWTVTICGPQQLLLLHVASHSPPSSSSSQKVQLKTLCNSTTTSLSFPAFQRPCLTVFISIHYLHLLKNLFYNQLQTDSLESVPNSHLKNGCSCLRKKAKCSRNCLLPTLAGFLSKGLEFFTQLHQLTPLGEFLSSLTFTNLKSWIWTLLYLTYTYTHYTHSHAYILTHTRTHSDIFFSLEMFGENTDSTALILAASSLSFYDHFS